ncbi:polysaccharide deacetylase family protein [Streptomyces prunicolor]
MRRFKTDGSTVTCVVESTNGLLDGPLLAAGLTVLRVDPWLLPQRPVSGSAPSRTLATRAKDNVGLLVPLDVQSGTLKGRTAEYDATIAGSADAEQALAKNGLFLERGGSTEKQIALTFDDGPSPYTSDILDILRHYGAKATFFCVGLHADCYPETVARIAAEGHLLGNHTWSHPFVPDLTRDEMRFQIQATNRAIRLVTDTEPTLVRPPYGSRTADALNWLAEMGMTTMLWDTDSRDWSLPGPEGIVTNALAQARNGSIVLMHDGGGNREETVMALPAILESLLEQRYTLVTADRFTSPPGSPVLQGVLPGVSSGEQ